MDLERRFSELVDELCSRPGVVPPGGSGFGSHALKVDGSIFAMFVRGHLVVKLPSARVTELVAGGTGGPFDANKGRAMKEWLTVLDESAWHALAVEASEFVRRS
jgi:TfoX/Sxy family transcriptional regulator of competence genes